MFDLTLWSRVILEKPITTKSIEKFIEVWSSHNGVPEDSFLLGYYVVSSGKQSPSNSEKGDTMILQNTGSAFQKT